MLGSKNRWKSGNCSLALPLQHSNLKFLDISEIGVTDRFGKEVDFKHVILCVFNSKIGFLVCSGVSPPAAKISKSENIILKRIDLYLI